MKKYYLAIVLISLCFSVLNAQVGKLEIGTKFPTQKLSNQKGAGGNTLVVFMPSLTYDTEYASMLTQSFYYYFDQRLAFEGLAKRPDTRIILVVNDKQNEAKSRQNILGGMTVIYDEKGEIFSSVGVKQPVSKNAASTVVLLDPDDQIAFIDEAYRSQGEHLKPLENKLKELNGVQMTPRSTKARKALKIGDKAADFRVNDKEMLSDLRGTVVLLTFYPAAFSGALPKPAEAGEIQLATVNFTPMDLQSVSCISQISLLDFSLKPKRVKPKRTPRRIAITSSTEPLLEKWKTLLDTQNIEYANDPDYSAASSYLAFNPAGYNNRVSVIVDQKGRIAYIDPEYSFFDEYELNRKIEELQNKEN